MRMHKDNVAARYMLLPDSMFINSKKNHGSWHEEDTSEDVEMPRARLCQEFILNILNFSSKNLSGKKQKTNLS